METKHYILAIIIVMVAGFVLLAAMDIIPLGSMVAGLSGLWAVLKSKLLRIPGINSDDIFKRAGKLLETSEGNKETRYLLLKEKLDYIDYKTARMEMQLDDLKKRIKP